MADRCGWLWLLCLLYAGPLWAQVVAPFELASSVRIDALRLVGNEVTRNHIIEREMDLDLPGVFDAARIEQALQAVRDLGLFKRVEAELLEEQGQRVLRVSMEEKFFILPIPRLDIKPEGDIKYGIELRLDNISGLNQRLKLLYRNKQNFLEEIPLRRELELSYLYPHAFDSPYTLDLATSMDRQIETLEPPDASLYTRYLRDYRQTHVEVGRWLVPEGPSRGWHLSGGLLLRQNFYHHIEGDAGLRDSTRAVALVSDIHYQGVHDHGYHRSGESYGYLLELGSPLLGSEYSYHHNQLYLRLYHPLDLLGNHSVHSQLRLGVANGYLFDGPAFSLGGAGSLRGYESTNHTGNAYLQLNLEYLRQIGGYRQLRGLIFTDIGNTYEDIYALRHGGLLHAYGIGLRWKVQTFVNITLSVDYAHNPRSGERRTYFTTGGSF